MLQPRGSQRLGHDSGTERQPRSRLLPPNSQGAVCVLSRVRLCDPLEPARLLCPGDLPGETPGLPRPSPWDGTHVARISCTVRRALYHRAARGAHRRLRKNLAPRSLVKQAVVEETPHPGTSPGQPTRSDQG